MNKTLLFYLKNYEKFKIKKKNYKELEVTLNGDFKLTPTKNFLDIN